MLVATSCATTGTDDDVAAFSDASTFENVTVGSPTIHGSQDLGEVQIDELANPPTELLFDGSQTLAGFSIDVETQPEQAVEVSFPLTGYEQSMGPLVVLWGDNIEALEVLPTIYREGTLTIEVDHFSTPLVSTLGDLGQSLSQFLRGRSGVEDPECSGAAELDGVRLVAVSGSAVKWCAEGNDDGSVTICLLYTSPSPRDRQKSRMPSSA